MPGVSSERSSHFQAAKLVRTISVLRIQLESQPRVFDEIRAGTETRDPENTVQHLQQYQSYGIMRYFEHIKPVSLAAAGLMSDSVRR